MIIKITIYLLAFVVAWFPFSVDLLKVELGIVTFTLYMLGMFVLTPIAVVNFLRKPHLHPIKLIDLLVLLISFIYFANTIEPVIWSKEITASGYLAFHAIFMPVLSYIVTRGIVENRLDYEKVLKAYLVGNIIFSLFVIISVTKFGLSKRVEVFSRDSIAIATFCLQPLLYYLYSNRRKSHIGMMVIGLAFIALVVSYSRAYLVLFLISPLLYYIARKGYASLFFVVFMIVSLVGTLIIIDNVEILKAGKWEPKYENSLERITNPDYWMIGLYSRIKLFSDSFSIYLKHPILGIGMAASKGFGTTTVHNVHLEWLVYGGTFGYLIFFTLFYMHFKSLENLAKVNADCAINLMLLLTIFVNALTNGFMHGVMPYAAFLLLAFGQMQYFYYLSSQISKKSIGPAMMLHHRALSK